jgi:predicted transcriptional regulator
MKQFSVEFDDSTIAELERQAANEQRTVGEIVVEAVRDYTRRHGREHEDVVALAHAIAREDASLLEALRNA